MFPEKNKVIGVNSLWSGTAEQEWCPWTISGLQQWLEACCCFFLFGFYGLSKLFHSFLAESIVRWGKNGRSPRKNTWPPASRIWLLSHVTRARRWDDEQFRALKISVLNHSATGWPETFWQVKSFDSQKFWQLNPETSTWMFSCPFQDWTN